MNRILLILTINTAVVLAQVPAPKTSPASTKPAEGTAKLADTVPVITIHGICDGDHQASATAPCTTVVTRQQFETALGIVKATSRGPVPPVPISVAQGYSDLLVYGNAAKKAGTDQDPRFKQVLEMTRLRALSDLYHLDREERAHQVSPGEIQAYYQKNLPSFEQLKLRRFFLPRNNAANLQDPDFRAKATKLAHDLRERAAKGEDLDQLQKEGFEALGVKTPAETLLAPVRRGEFDAKAETELFALQPGQVSSVMEIPSVYIVYKLESRRMLPLDEVKEEISNKLYLQNVENLTKSLTGSISIDYNEGYFGAVAKSAWVSAGANAGSTAHGEKTASPRN